MFSFFALFCCPKVSVLKFVQSLFIGNLNKINLLCCVALRKVYIQQYELQPKIATCVIK